MTHLYRQGSSRAFCGLKAKEASYYTDEVTCLRCLHCYRNYVFGQSLTNTLKRGFYKSVVERIWFLTDAKGKSKQIKESKK